VACFFALLAMVVADHAIRKRRFESLDAVAVVCASGLAILSRQGLFYWPLLVGLMFLLARAWRWMSRSQLISLTAALLAVFAVGGWTFFGLLSGIDNMDSVSLLARTFTPSRLLFLSQYHTFLRDGPSFLLTSLVLVGAFAVVRSRDPTGLSMMAGAGLAGGASFGTTVTPSFLNEYGFLLPLAAFSAPLAGVGTDAVRLGVMRLTSRYTIGDGKGKVVAAVVLSAATALTVAQLWGVVGKRDALAQEYELTERHAASLPAGSTVLIPLLDCHGGSPKPCFATLPSAPFRNRRSDVRLLALGEHDRPRGSGPIFVMQNVACFSYGGRELLTDVARQPGWKGLTDADGKEFERMVRAFWRWPRGSETLLSRELPTGMRPECRAAIPEAATFTSWGEVEMFRHDMPMIFFTSMKMPIGVWRIDGGT
jgi:hypothetical protein